MSKTLEITQESSLNAPPVYRRFLAGGDDALRLSRLSAMLIIGLGVASTALSMTLAGLQNPRFALSSGLAGTIAALITAAFAAHWLGGRIGLLSGCIYLMSGRVLWAIGSSSEHWLAVLAVAAVSIFATANVAGRLPLLTNRRLSFVFYAILAAIYCTMGAAPAVGVFVTCLAYLAIGRECRGIRFFADWIVLVVLAGAVTVAWLFWGQFPIRSTALLLPTDVCLTSASAHGLHSSMHTFYNLLLVDIPVSLLPWGPLSLVAVVVGLRNGHYATPLGKLLCVWIVVPLLLALAGLLRGPDAISVVFSPLIILCCLGLGEVLMRLIPIWRKIYRF